MNDVTVVVCDCDDIVARLTMIDDETFIATSNDLA
jgi:hypothetical protein